MSYFRVWAIVLLFAAFAQPAAAQVRVQPSMPLGLAPGASGVQSDGITVSAFGSATAPAAKATVELRITSRTALDAASLTPAVDALVRAGVARSAIVVPTFVSTPNQPDRFASLSFTVDHPTKAMVDAALPGVAIAFITAGLNVNSATIRLASGPCDAYVAAARALAIKNARKRAEAYAADLGIRVGAVRAVWGSDATSDASGACTTTMQVPYGSPDQEVRMDDLAVPVNANVTIRYAIR